MRAVRTARGASRSPGRGIAVHAMLGRLAGRGAAVHAMLGRAVGRAGGNDSGCSLEHGAQVIGVRVREGAGLHFEFVVPVAAAEAFRQIAGNGQRPGLPLFDDVAIFVEH